MRTWPTWSQYLDLFSALIEMPRTCHHEVVTNDDFMKALQEVRPSVTPEVERKYEDMLKTLRQEDPKPKRFGFI